MPNRSEQFRNRLFEVYSQAAPKAGAADICFVSSDDLDAALIGAAFLLLFASSESRPPFERIAIQAPGATEIAKRIVDEAITRWPDDPPDKVSAAVLARLVLPGSGDRPSAVLAAVTPVSDPRLHPWQIEEATVHLVGEIIAATAGAPVPAYCLVVVPTHHPFGASARSSLQDAPWGVFSLQEEKVIFDSAMSRLRETLFAKEEPEQQLTYLVKLLETVFGYLGRHPYDGERRIDLTQALATGRSGGLGLATLRKLALGPTTTVGTPPRRDIGSALDPKDVFAFFKKYMEGTEHKALVPEPVPAQLMPENPAGYLHGLLEMARMSALDSEFSWSFFISLMKPALDLSLATDGLLRPTEVVRQGCQMLAVGGRLQESRDLVETALLCTKSDNDPAARKIAWLAFADVYLRCHNLEEALLGVCCARSIAVEFAYRDHVIQELTLLARLSRELGDVDAALRFAAEAMSHAEAVHDDQLKRELTVLRVGIAVQARRDEEDWESLADAIANVLEQELDRDGMPDLLLPPTALLGQMLRRSNGRDPTTTGRLRTLFERALRCLPDSARARFEALADDSPSWSTASKILLAPITVRDFHDLGTDLHERALLARRVLETAANASDFEGAFHALEVLRDQTIRLDRRKSGNTVPYDVQALAFEDLAADRKDELFSALLARQEKDSPEQVHVATQASVERIQDLLKAVPEPTQVYGFGFDASDRLVQTSLASGDGSRRIVTPAFGRVELAAWRARYPLAYGRDPHSLSQMLESMRGLHLELENDAGLALLMPTLSLCDVPANLFVVDGEPLGVTRPVAMVPSLAWLEQLLTSTPDHRHTKRVAIAFEPGSGFTGLQALLSRMEEVLPAKGFSVKSEAPEHASIAGSDVAVLAAHGGVGPIGRYLTRVVGEQDLKLFGDEVGRMFEGVRVAVLFICSGARGDSEPFSQRTVGLFASALRAGARTVIGSPWPIGATSAARWLRYFVDAWGADTFVANAVFEANRRLMSDTDDASEYLAMQVHGNPWELGL